jgi:hypothetical protein
MGFPQSVGSLPLYYWLARVRRRPPRTGKAPQQCKHKAQQPGNPRGEKPKPTNPRACLFVCSQPETSNEDASRKTNDECASKHESHCPHDDEGDPLDHLRTILSRHAPFAVTAPHSLHSPPEVEAAAVPGAMMYPHLRIP